MSDGTLFVDCPCCGVRIEARRDDGRVVGHFKKSPKVEGDPIKAALERDKADKERFKNLLSNARDIVERQKRDALEKFDRERKRIEQEKDDSPPPSPFGFD